MEQEIKDVIAKNLPSHVGEELQKRLKECDRLEKEALKQSKEIDRLNSALSDVVTENDMLRGENEQAQSILKREESLKKAEELFYIRQNAKDDVLEVRELCAEARINDMKDLIRGVFANHQIHKTITGTKDQPPFNDAQGYTQYPGALSHTVTETTELP